MWTHRKPYFRSQLTRSSIQYHGEIGLYRSINIGRLVAFVGSGVSVAYNRPTWLQLVEIAFAHVSQQYIDNFERTHSGGSKQDLHSLWRAHETLKALHKDVETSEGTGSTDGEKLKLVLELCEHLAQRMDEYCRDSGIRTAETFVRSFRRKLTESVAPNWPQAGTIPRNLHPIHAIYYDLRIRRFLTTNYDTALEWFLVREKGFSKDGSEGGLEILIQPPKPDPARRLPNQHRQFALDEFGRSALSVTLTDDSIGQLLAFSAFPQAHEAQVFHLHGRIDDPANLIVSERDYQRAYLSQTLARLPFQEALDTLFLGNDVIFIGVGMGESDLLRPLRQFVADDQAPDTESRRIFALLPRQFEVEAIARAIDFRVRYGVQTLYFGDEFFAYQIQVINALRRHLETLGPSLDEQLRKILRPMLTDAEIDQMIERGLDPSKVERAVALRDIAGRENYSTHDALRVLFPRHVMEKVVRPDELVFADFGFLLDRVISGSGEGLRQFLGSFENAFQIDALNAKLADIVRRQRRWWRDWLTSPRERRARFGFYEHESAADGAVPSRVEIWGRSRPSYQSGSRPKRPSTPFQQAIDHAKQQFGSPQRIQAADADRREGALGRRILRFANRRGEGKGFFFNELQDDGNLGKLFPLPDDNIANPYRAAFFAHTSFSLEFSSVIGALIAFVAKMATTKSDLEHAKKWIENENAINLKKHGRPRGDLPNPEHLGEHPYLLLDIGAAAPGPLWDPAHPPNRLHQALKVLGRYKDQHRDAGPAEQIRLFIGLSGLERLCDTDGIAHNPFHRAFFRILTDGRLADAPFDLVLLSGDPERPILYLSDEEYIVAGQEVAQNELSKGRARLTGRADHLRGSVSSVARDETEASPELVWHTKTRLSVRLKPWVLLKPLPLHERYWLEYEAPDGESGGSGFVSLNALDQAPFLRSLIEKSVALDTWVSLCAKACFDPESGQPHNAAFAKLNEDRHDWIARLDQAAAKGGANDILQEIFRTYRLIDDATDHMIRGIILRHLALFSLPVQPLVLLTCPDILQSLQNSKEGDVQEAGRPADSEALRFARVQGHLKILAERGIVTRVAPWQKRSETVADRAAADAEEPFHERFVLHAQMREFLARQMRFDMPDRGERNFFQVSVYPIQPRDLPIPSEAHFRLIHQVVSRLINSCRDTLQPFYQAREKYERERRHYRMHPGAHDTDTEHRAAPSVQLADSAPGSNEIHAVPQKLRAVYSILRLSFSIATLSRLKKFTAHPDEPEEPYEIYRAWLRGLLNAAVGLSYLSDRREDGDQDAFRKRLEKSSFSLRGAFYREEIIWLYNERALTAFAQGRLYDAIPIFGQALNFARRISGGSEDEAHRAAERRISLNLALAQIERGNLKKARSMLEKLVARGDRPVLPNRGVTNELARGFLGLCDHLSGNLESGRRGYARMIEFATERDLFRTLSIFYRHYGDLLRILGDVKQAEHQLRLSVLSASQHEQNDILQLALIAQARMARDVKDTSKLIDARRLLDEAEKYADDMGLVKVKVEALKVRSDIIFAQGELEQAGRVAARAVALANRHGMRLRKLSSLILYGRILHRRGQIDLATAVLTETAREAERHGYQLKVDLAQRTMRDLT